MQCNFMLEAIIAKIEQVKHTTQALKSNCSLSSKLEYGLKARYAILDSPQFLKNSRGEWKLRVGRL